MEAKFDLSQRVRSLLHMAQSANTMFGPGQPPVSMWNDEPPRLFEYQPGQNLVTVPRAGYSVLPFSALRALSTASKEIRLNIELIKRTIRGLTWDILPRKDSYNVGNVTYQAETKSVRQFFERPDGINDFDSWLNQLLESLLTIDAVTIYPDMNGKKLVSLDLVDGATIRPLLDLRGRIPRAPQPAYLQVLYGVPTTHYSADDLIYAPLNTKTHTPYGESPIEWAIMAINTAIFHDAVRMGLFTEGNIPGVLISVSPEWTNDQLQMFTAYFDALAKGDIQRASKILFVPGGASQSIFQPQQGDVDKIEVDKWLMQVICWAFGNNPAEFGLISSSGLGGAGYTASMENAQYRSMIGPISGYLKSLFDRIICDYMNRSDIEFRWIGLEPPEDELVRAQIDQMYIMAGVYSPSYVQSRLGVPEQYRNVSVTTSQAGLQNLASLLPFLQRAASSDLTVDTDGGIQEINTMFRSMWDNYRLSVSKIYVNAQEADNITRKVLSASSASINYVTGAEFGGGMRIKSLLNRFAMGAAPEVPISIHPYLPPGTLLAVTEQLPYPMTGIPNVMEMRLRQDYYQIEWPQRERQYESGVYFNGVLAHYFPPSLGIITNIGNA